MSPRDLPPGVYPSGRGYRAIINCAAGRKSKTFAPGTPLADIKRWRTAEKVKLERKHPQRRAGAIGRDTFAAAVRSYLKTLAIASWKSRRSELRAWVARVGHLRRSAVTSEHVKAAIKAWSDAGVASKTILNRIRALTAMYHDLDGEEAWTPADGVKPPRIQRRVSPYVAVSVILAVEQRLREQEAAGEVDPRWRARFMVLAATGQRPAFVRRAVPGDVDLERAEWSIHAAKGGNPIVLPLNRDMLAAWRRFIEADAWTKSVSGKPDTPRTLEDAFDPTEYAKVVRAAGWPAEQRPYSLKHALSRDLREQGVDLETIADWHGHTGGFTTTRLYTGFAAKQLRNASEAIEGRLGWGEAVVSESPSDKIARLRAELRAAVLAAKA